MEAAIKKAVEGGWSDAYFFKWSNTNNQYKVYFKGDILIDPRFWQALGKALNLADVHFPAVGHAVHICCADCLSWQGIWHDFIDHLIVGQDADSFFTSLLQTHEK